MRRIDFNDQRLVLSYVRAHLDGRGRFPFFTEDVADMARSLHMPMETLGDIVTRVDRDWVKLRSAA